MSDCLDQFDSTSGGARRVLVGRPQMAEDLDDHRWVFDRGDKNQNAAAVGACSKSKSNSVIATREIQALTIQLFRRCDLPTRSTAAAWFRESPQQMPRVLSIG